jgi:hypothetical protein
MVEHRERDNCGKHRAVSMTARDSSSSRTKGKSFRTAFFPFQQATYVPRKLVAIYRDSPLFRDLRDTSKLEGKCGSCEFKEICGGSRPRICSDREPIRRRALLLLCSERLRAISVANQDGNNASCSSGRLKTTRAVEWATIKGITEIEGAECNGDSDRC